MSNYVILIFFSFLKWVNYLLLKKKTLSIDLNFFKVSVNINVQCSFFEGSKYAMMLFCFLALGSDCTSNIGYLAKAFTGSEKPNIISLSNFWPSKNYLLSTIYISIMEIFMYFMMLLQTNFRLGHFLSKQLF